jgi:hypothetical protein
MSCILRPGVSWCTCARRTVFLDLARDRYFCLSEALDGYFRRWSAGNDLEPFEGDSLMAAGVLVPGSAAPAAPASYMAPTRDFASGGHAHSFSDTLAAVGGQLRARSRLKRRSLADVIAGDIPRNPRLPYRVRDEAVLTRIAGAFVTSGMLLRAADQCLPRAIAAARLCRRQRQEVALIFGVRLDPFAAHSWVQSDDAVIVGDLEQARLYTPILVLP